MTVFKNWPILVKATFKCDLYYKTEGTEANYINETKLLES